MSLLVDSRVARFRRSIRVHDYVLEDSPVAVKLCCHLESSWIAALKPSEILSQRKEGSCVVLKQA